MTPGQIAGNILAVVLTVMVVLVVIATGMRLVFWIWPW